MLLGNCRCFRIKGAVFARPVDTSTPSFNPNNVVGREWFKIGNAGNLNTTPTQKEYSVPNNEDCCGGDYCYGTEIEKIDFSLETTCFDAKVAAMALRGNVTSSTLGAKTVPAFGVTRGGIVPLGPYADPATVVITAGATPLVNGTDFVVQGTIAIILDNAPNVPPGVVTNVSVAWNQTADHFRVDMFASCSAQEFEILLAGKNCMDPNDGGVLEYLYRVSLSGASDFNLIGDDVGKFTLKGRLLPDKRLVSGSPFGTFSM
jgi:hypothetical protein